MARADWRSAWDASDLDAYEVWRMMIESSRPSPRGWKPSHSVGKARRRRVRGGPPRPFSTRHFASQGGFAQTARSGT